MFNVYVIILAKGTTSSALLLLIGW